jgi:hypothetical protein
MAASKMKNVAAMAAIKTRFNLIIRVLPFMPRRLTPRDGIPATSVTDQPGDFAGLVGDEADPRRSEAFHVGAPEIFLGAIISWARLQVYLGGLQCVSLSQHLVVPS